MNFSELLNFEGTEALTSMITIKEVGPAHFEMLAELGRKAFYEAFSEHNDPDDMQAYLDLAFNPETIKKQLEDPAVTYLVAYWKDLPVGYAKLKQSDVPEKLAGKSAIQLERIYALQEFVGKKVGKALMEACIRIAKSHNYDAMWLGVWQQNDRAISFYKKWGFTIIGTKQFIIGKDVNDDFVMSLDLNQNGTAKL
ncbi:MAG: GNAT family N-acetyltransferase [Bacteroidia bacterium]|nr:GNAT family N-acetyltransferase [Bacteroidia bacterium]